MSVIAVSVFVIVPFRCDVSGDAARCVLCCDQVGRTALLAACEHGHVDVARWLVTNAGSDARLERYDVSCVCCTVDVLHRWQCASLCLFAKPAYLAICRCRAGRQP